MAWDNEETNVRFKNYSHSSKDSNWEMLNDDMWEFDEDSFANEEAARNFVYTLYEVEFDCEVDLDTGEVRCWGVNGVSLAEPIVGI